MNIFSRKPDVNIIFSHKSDIFMEGAPCGESRLYENALWDKVGQKVNASFIHLKRPFKKRIPFSQNLEMVLYHMRNIGTFRRLKNSEAVTHIHFAEESWPLNFVRLKKTIVSCLDIIPIAFPSGIPWHNRAMYRRFISGMRRADMILTVSEYSKTDISKHLHIDPQKIRVLHWGISEIFRPLREIPREWYVAMGLNPKRRFLLSVGALDFERKNTAALVTIFPKLAHEFPDLDLVIAGYHNVAHEDPLKTANVKNIPSALKGRIHILKQIPDDDLVKLYNAAHVFVFPSLYEGFGLPPLEAMACGTPVVASGLTSVPEAVGQGGLLVDPRDENALTKAVSEMIENQNTRRHFIKEGFKQAKKFTWDRYAKGLVDLYRELDHKKES